MSIRTLADKLIAWDEQAFLDLNAWLHAVSTEHLDIGSALRAANEFGTGWILVLAVVAIVGVEADRKLGARRILELGAACALAGYVAYLLKDWVGRPRPQRALWEAFEQGIAHVGFGERALDSSWPSGHTASAFAAATVLAWWTRGIGERDRRRFVRTMFFLIAGATGVARVYGAAHYPLDVVSGAILGITLGTVIVIFSRQLGGAYPRH